jgi:hypothetical protein
MECYSIGHCVVKSSYEYVASSELLRPRCNGLCKCVVWYVQGDSGGNVNILEYYSIGHCEVKSSYEYVASSELLPRQSYLNLQIL